jgi:lipoprotein-releasing system permease protein
VLGSKLAEATGMLLGSVITVISPQGELSPFGMRPNYESFRVTGIFESGFFDLDNGFAFTTLENAQRLFSTGDVVNAIELKLADLNRAPQVAREAEAAAGGDLGATHWMEQNRQLLNALGMEKTVSVVTIGLIQLVAALNILIALVMGVMEKQRDIALLMAMGAREGQIRRVFMLQGLLIGATGAAIGLVAGHLLCSFGERYHWIPLDEAIYSLTYVPFDSRWTDSIWVAATALAVSFLATLYPAHAAARVVPVETLRYE